MRTLKDTFFADGSSEQVGQVCLQQVRDWFASSRGPKMSEKECVEFWHTQSAQCRFLKTLPFGARVLDVGAGDGSLQTYRAWPAPPRPDLEMHAFAMDEGVHFHLYDGYTLGAWPSDAAKFEGQTFDAVNARNFIEHIEHPETFVTWACEKLAPGGGLFLEWPTPASRFLPARDELATFGLRVFVGHYFDDLTHQQEVPRLSAVVERIEAAGLAIESYGIARSRFVEDELLAHGIANDDIVAMTLAYWSFSEWCHYLVARRPEPPTSS